MFSSNIVSDGFQSVIVLVFFVDVCCVGTDSNHKWCLPDDIPCCVSGWNAKHVAPPSSSFFFPQFRPRASTPPKENRFFDDLRKRHPVFLDPQKQKNSWISRRFLDKNSRVSLPRTDENTNESTTPVIARTSTVSIPVTVIISSTPYTRPRYGVSCSLDQERLRTIVFATIAPDV